MYFHVLRNSYGRGGVDLQDVNTALNILNDDFNDSGISFLREDSIDFIDDSNKYLSPDTTIFNFHNHSNGIDIYLYSGNTSVGGGQSKGFGRGTGISLYGKIQGFLTACTHVISHEMGHVLNLYHTHHGTIHEDGGDSNQCAELVDGSNSDVCGDYVEDTPADPCISQNVNSSCNWAYQGMVHDNNYKV